MDWISKIAAMQWSLAWGSVADWITVGIAVLAAIVGWLSIRVQREIARKRAAVDFFVKTEMDKDTLEAHKKYTSAIEQLQQHIAQENKTLEGFSKTDAYWDIRGYLNLHELVGVSINQDVFDDNVCYDFWSGELRRAYRDTRTLVEYI